VREHIAAVQVQQPLAVVPRLLADALISIVSASLPRERLVRNALAAVSERTWESSLDKLAVGYRAALDQRAPRRARSVA
jgi:hypothetical protein